jgi:AcrR family transcriptional regulator
LSVYRVQEPALPRTATRRRILDAAYELCYREGFARVGVDAVAAAAGVTKRTLYDHFASKDDLLAAVLDQQHDLALRRIGAWLGPQAADGPAVARRLFEALAAWAARPRWQGSGFSRAAIELAALPGHPARAAARRHKAAVEAALAERLAAAGTPEPAARARELMLLLEGAMALLLIHGERGYAAAAAEAAARLLRTADEPARRRRGRAAPR